MEWKEEEEKKFVALWERGAGWPQFAALAVELAASRGGTMTGDRLADLMSEVPSQEWVDEVMAHISALGARNALLEAQRKLDAEHDAVTRRELGAGPSETVLGLARRLHHEATLLKERLSAAEDGNRERVRRAQQAEALLERERESARMWSKRAIAAVEERDELKARCATLSAAGQMPSAHVSNDARAATTDCPTSERCVICGAAVGDACNPRVRGHLRECGEPVDCALLKRYPCSPTCTHDDAAKPRHPERVKERSEAVTISLNSATHRKVDENGKCRHYERWSECNLCDGYEEGAEAMRAACWEAVQGYFQRIGLDRAAPMWGEVKASIEGAVP